MLVLSIVSTKGGVGKTTLAVHLAVAAHAEGAATLLLDLDPQASAVQWWKDRQRTLVERGQTSAVKFDVRRADAKSLGDMVDAAERDGFAQIIIDTPPHADFPAARAVEVADLVLMPSRPGYFDLHAAKPTIKLIQDLKKPAFFVMNQVPHNSQGIGLEASDYLELKGVKRGPLAITLLQPFSRCLRDGLTAQELFPGGRHDAEISDLWRWTKASLDVARLQQQRAPKQRTQAKRTSDMLGDPFAELGLTPLDESVS